MWHTKVTNVIFDITNTNLEKSSERPPMRGKLQNQRKTSDLTMPWYTLGVNFSFIASFSFQF